MGLKISCPQCHIFIYEFSILIFFLTHMARLFSFPCFLGFLNYVQWLKQNYNTVWCGSKCIWKKYLKQFFFFLRFIYWLIDWLLCWVFVSVRGLSLAAASGGHSSSRCTGLSPSRPLPLRSTGSRHAGSAVVVHGPSCSMACGILPDQGSNPCPLH